MGNKLEQKKNMHHLLRQWISRVYFLKNVMQYADGYIYKFQLWFTFSPQKKKKKEKKDLPMDMMEPTNKSFSDCIMCLIVSKT